MQRTIDSVIAQNFTNWELIIVDDGSTDNTEVTIKKYLTDSRIKYVKKENTGQAHSLNIGVSYAQNNFIVFLDSDDEAYPNWLDAVFKNLNDDTGIACVGAVTKNLDGSLTKEIPYDYTLFGQTNKIKYTCGSLFIRKSLFSEINGYDTSLQSNIQQDLCIRLLHYMKDKNLKVVFLNQCLVQINIHNQPRIRTNWKKMRDGSIQFLNKHYDLIYKNDPQTTAKFCAIIAYSSFKLKDKKQAIQYSIKAMKYDPMQLKNYVRILRYAFA